MSVSDQARGTGAAEVLSGGGEMGALVRAVDWAATPLGPVEGWPRSLITAATLVLESRYPMMVLWGPDLIQIYNDAFRPILGATKHPAALGQRASACWSEIWDVISPLFARVWETGEAVWMEDLLLLLDRYGYLEETHFAFSYSPLRDDTGRIGGILVTCTETTERVLGERRLRMLRDLAARTAAATTMTEVCALAARTLAENCADIPCALLYLLDAAATEARLAATTGPETGTRAIPDRADLAAATEPDGVWPLAQAARTGQAVLVENPAALFGAPALPAEAPAPQSALILPVAHGGRERPTALLVAGVSPRRALDDDYRGFFHLVAGQIATAIGNARAYEEERHRAEALAELDRAKTAFFSNVSHEFRTPLTLLLGPLEETLAAPPETPLGAERAQLESAHRNSLRLLKLVNTLLDVARIEAGRAEAVYEPTDLAALTAELASAFHAASERAGLRLVVDCPPLPEPLYVDHEMWEKVVLNLLSNAVKFTFEGEIVVVLRAAGERVRLEVRDTGTGIPAEELPHLFERFHRVRGARARTHEGTGIGLALVRELVALHGGTIGVESVVDGGTTFTVTLPLGTAHLPPERIGAARTGASTALGVAPYVDEALRWLSDADPGETAGTDLPADATAPPGVGAPTAAAPAARVVLADDNADMRAYVRRLLGARYAVEAVSNGCEALAAVRAQPPDLVLADVMMPGMDGFALVQALRADLRTRTVPVILLSARAGPEATAAGLQAGADDYLVKPFAASELLARVQAHVALAQLRQEARDALAAERDRLQAEVAARTQAEEALRHSHEHLRRALARLQRLQAVSDAALSQLALPALLHQVLERITAVLEVDNTAILLLEETEDTLIVHHALGPEEVQTGQMRVPVGQGVAGRIAASRQPLIVADLRTVEPVNPLLREQMASLMGVPLLVEGRLLGVMHVDSATPRQFTDDDLHLLQLVADRVALALDNARLYHGALEARDLVARLQRTTADLSAAVTTEEVADVIITHGLVALGATAGAVALLSDDGASLTTVRRAGYAPEVVAAWPGFPPDAAVPIADAVRAREPVILESRGEHDARYPHLAGVHAEGPDGALVAIPLLLGERAVGGLGLRFPTTRRFGAEERAVMRALGELCAQALERARAQEDLRASEERYRAIAETANEGIWLIDRAARTLFANARLAALLGTTVDDVVARTVLDFVFEEDRPLAQERLGQNLAGVAEQFDFRFRRADGAPVQVLACTSPVHAADGTIVGALGMFSDITALRELERAREEFLSSAAHDLKTPLTSIRGQAQLAQRRLTRLDTPETAPALVQLARIQEGTDAMVGLIDELVDVTRQQMGGGLELHRAPVDLVALVQGSVEAHRDASGRPIHLEVAVSELHADVDAARVGRVVGNLLSNALKYSPAESAIWVRLAPEDGAAGPEAVLVVRDEGIGIPAADLAHIFDRFARAGNVVGHIQGTGIGLASARGIVEQHGGTIAVESTEGVGSTFTVRLPLGHPAVHRGGGR